MVAKSPTSASAREKRLAALLGESAASGRGVNPALINETLKKVDRCVARLQELQYTVAGGRKVVGGTTLSPRSTRGYIKTSLRCKQETVSRLKTFGGTNGQQQRSPTGKFPQPQRGGAGAGKEWRRMSPPAMLLGETVLEIVKASEFAKQVSEAVVAAAGDGKTAALAGDNNDPKTPIVTRRGFGEKIQPEEDDQLQKQLRTPSSGLLRASRCTRDREKLQRRERLLRSTEPRSPALRRARARITFKTNSPPPAALSRYGKKVGDALNPADSILVPGPNSNYNHRAEAATRKTAVLFPNPTFRSNTTTTTTATATATTSPPSRLRSLGNNSNTAKRTTQPSQKLPRFKSPTIIPGMIKRVPAVKPRTPPHKFLIKSPPSTRKTPGNGSAGKFQVRIRSPPPAIASIRSPARQQRLLTVTEAAASPPQRRRSFSPAKLLRRSFSPSRLASRLMSPIKSRISAVTAASRRKSTAGTTVITATTAPTATADQSMPLPMRPESFTTPVRLRKQPRTNALHHRPLVTITIHDRPPRALAV